MENIAVLKPKQERLLIAMLSEPNFDKAVKQAGISKKTAYRYRNDPIFHNEYMKQRRELMSHTTGLLQQASRGAVSVLYSIATNKDESANARVQASRTILEYAYKGVELEDIQNRLDYLEQLND